jgi:SsrA-binding protein
MYARMTNMSLIVNKKATLNYEILEKYVAGIELFGYEVKSLLAGHGQLEGSHVTIRGGEAYVIGMTIPPYQPGNTPDDYDPARNRKLLLNKAEIHDLTDVEQKDRLTIIPLSVYNKGSKLKLDIAVVRGKKKFDKRETLKKRATDRDIERMLKNKGSR